MSKLDFHPPQGEKLFRFLHFGPQGANTGIVQTVEKMQFVDQLKVDYGFYKGDFDYKIDAQSIQFPDNFVDAILILHVLEHVPKVTIIITFRIP
eukprot:UN01455